MNVRDANIDPARCWRRAGFVPHLLALLLLALVVAGCGTTAATAQAELPTLPTSPPTAVPTSTAAVTPQDSTSSDEGAGAAEVTTSPDPLPTPHPIAAADTELPPAPIGFDDLFDAGPSGPQPVSIEIEDINVSDADIIAVGVNDDLTFEVPPADQVGWYEFGSAPGEPGSAVLAAHIAYNGVDGVFRYLEDVEIGAIVIVRFDDGTSQRYQIEEVTEYVKEALPDSLFARDGKEQLALITCGGTFNYQLDSYESNTVAIAVPI